MLPVAVHVDVGVAAWVSLMPGVHDLDVGEAVEARVDPRRLFVFDSAGALAAAPDAAF